MSEIPPSESGRPSGAFPFKPRNSGEQTARVPYAPRGSAPAATPPPEFPPESALPPPPPPEPKRVAPPPLPPAETGVPPLPSAAPPVPFRSSFPPPAATIEEETADPADRRKSLMLVAGLVVVVAIGGSIAALSAIKSFGKTAGNKKGLLHAAAYAQTRQRLMLIGHATMQYYDRYKAWPTVGADLIEFGVDPGILQDKFGNRFVYEGSIITSMGEDGKMGTDDDMWFDAASFEVGGYTGEEALENLGMLPPEVSTALKQARMASERAQGNREQMEYMLREAETGMGMPEDGSYSQEYYPSSTSSLEYMQDSNMSSGRESDE